MTLLRNGNFEADWSEEKSHHCWVFPTGAAPYEKEVGNIFNPPGWTCWFRHEEGMWAQPEGRDARAKDPARMHGGEKGYLLFTFSRKHDAGLMQQVQVSPGQKLRFSAWAHAWSNHKAPQDPDKFPHPDDPRWSDGAGYSAVAWEEGSQPLTGDPQQDARSNFTFWAGIDPTGGTNPFADSVVWGTGMHIYNTFHELPAVEAVAQSNVVTVFLRSRAIWAFKHNDAYWDDASLVVVGKEEPIYGINLPHPPDTGQMETLNQQSPGQRGKPRAQYERTYVLLPPGAGKEWAKTAAEAVWKKGYTVGRSADDAGVGDLDKRTVIAINPEQWGSGEDGSGLRGFFAKYYPGVQFRTVTAATPEQLRQVL